MRVARATVKGSLIRMLVVLLLVAGEAFPAVSPADASLILWDDYSKQDRIEGERGTVVDLPIKSEARKKPLPVGVWGGEHISMQVTKLVTTIEYDCAHGTIEQRISLDRRGRFAASGTQVIERGGPVRENDQSRGEPVQLTGQVSGKILKLTVRSSTTKELIGNFTLVYGAAGKLRKCL